MSDTETKQCSGCAKEFEFTREPGRHAPRKCPKCKGAAETPAPKKGKAKEAKPAPDLLYTYDEVIASLQEELGALDTRRDKINTAIAGLQGLQAEAA